jgi:glycosyltransferase involved in cell wall biosynthesis
MSRESRSALDVLFVGALPPHPGGSAISAGQILTGLAGRGHVIRGVAPMTEDAARDGDAFAARHPALRIARFAIPYFNVSPMNPIPEEDWSREEREVERLLTGLLRERRPDLLFVGREIYAACAATIAARWNLPFALRLPGGTTFGLLQGAYSPARTARLLAGYRAASLVISPGRHLAELVRARGVDRVTVVPSAVDIDEFAPRPRNAALLEALGIPPDAVVVAHFSNLKPIKRPMDLIESAPAALRRDGRLVYLIVGNGPLREAMEAACRAGGVRDRFRFAGWVDHAEIPAYLNLADIVVMPSEWEALARLYVETQACGRTLVASDIRAAREVVTDGETGVLFPVGDVAALTDTLVALAGAPDRRATIGRQARARIRPHSLDGAVDAYEELLHRAATDVRSR